MTRYSLLALSICALLLSSCDIRKSVNFDMSTNMSTLGDGLSCESVYLTSKEERIARTKFFDGERLTVNFNQVEGFVEKDGFVYPGGAIHITSAKGDTVLREDELFDDSKKYDHEHLLLQTSITAALPYRNNEKYEMHILLWDKNGSGTFTMDMPFEIVPDKNLKISATKADYESIYLWDGNEKHVITDKKIKLKNGVQLFIEGVSGFETIDHASYPKFSILAVDANGNEIISDDNVFRQYTESGVDAAGLAKQVYVTLTFNSVPPVNPVHLTAVLSDLKSDAEITIETELIVE